MAEYSRFPLPGTPVSLLKKMLILNIPIVTGFTSYLKPLTMKEGIYELWQARFSTKGMKNKSGVLHG
jgi:hypothetical protein